MLPAGAGRWMHREYEKGGHRVGGFCGRLFCMRFRQDGKAGTPETRYGFAPWSSRKETDGGNKSAESASYQNRIPVLLH